MPDHEHITLTERELVLLRCRVAEPGLLPMVHVDALVRQGLVREVSPMVYEATPKGRAVSTMEPWQCPCEVTDGE